MGLKDVAGVKSALASRTLHFNVWTWAIWPFLPQEFRHQPYAPMVVGAWFSIGNIALRFLTSEAISFWSKNGSKSASDTN